VSSCFGWGQIPYWALFLSKNLFEKHHIKHLYIVVTFNSRPMFLKLIINTIKFLNFRNVNVVFIVACVAINTVNKIN